MANIPFDFEIIILGDFNVNYLASKKDLCIAKQKLQNFANLHNFEQLIKSPTRVSESSNTTIDLLFSNNNHRTVESGVIPCAISDHSIIYCTVKSGVRRSPPQIIEHRSYPTYDKNAFIMD